MSEKPIPIEQLSDMPNTQALIGAVVEAMQYVATRFVRSDRVDAIREELADHMPGKDPAVAVSFVVLTPSGTPVTVTMGGVISVEAVR